MVFTARLLKTAAFCEAKQLARWQLDRIAEIYYDDGYLHEGKQTNTWFKVTQITYLTHVHVYHWFTEQYNSLSGSVINDDNQGGLGLIGTCNMQLLY